MNTLVTRQKARKAVERLTVYSNQEQDKGFSCECKAFLGITTQKQHFGGIKVCKQLLQHFPTQLSADQTLCTVMRAVETGTYYS